MQDTTGSFERLRPRLMAIGYRMLASVHEAEDLVQDAWLRWHEDEGRMQQGVANAEAWLVTMTTRMAIDRLRAAKVRREAYPGFWLPEPLAESGPETPEQTRELADDISVAFLVLLDRLSPESRAAFLLREVFDADYAQVAEAIGKSEAAARQVVSRAKAQLREAGPAPAVQPKLQYQVLRGFADALSRGDFHGLQALLAEQSELLSDGGGIVPSFGQALLGSRRIAQLYFAAFRNYGERMRVELVRFNGQWALLRWIDGRIESAQAFETDGQHILRIHVQRNPHKLARLSSGI
ncbi:sigma-70 family RNA polymerase sigma factor [Xylophilus rhododendri]|uniref:Sigma-70 family RNA polymerase sigma factor n=1 Tax=Xylophilus rhododendri TaxID=2697032 RepID=A0A857JEI6_9BURK|nr:RNA polymerase sigma factor SigJ [Xylophilus rhododendri]QHJ01096.1 sigma-70 family RNA polymerase sigma factor [Xylophilus rhododendri]